MDIDEPLPVKERYERKKAEIEAWLDQWYGKNQIVEKVR